MNLGALDWCKTFLTHHQISCDSTIRARWGPREEPSVYLVETKRQSELRATLRRYFADLLTDDVRRELGEPGEGSPAFRRLVARMGTDGWLGLGWPAEYGGQGRPPSDQFILFDEVQRAGAPFPFVTVNTVGPALIHHGSEEQRRAYLPGILAGVINFAIGYTEPSAGTDLASLRTAAVHDGDGWVINGAKVFTSGANQADFIWLACRTDPSAPKHRGISIIIVPTAAPGFSWTPIRTVGGSVTTATYYDDVRVPSANLVGSVNDGWRLITTQLNHERVGLAALTGLTQRLYDDVVTWCLSTGAIAEPWVQADLARCLVLLQPLRLMNWRLVQAVAGGTLTAAQASSVKVFGTEGAVNVYRLLSGIVGTDAHRRPGSPGALLHGELERAVRAAQINTFGGGVNEVQRDIVAAVGLGTARAAR
jgi:alkylation response protein AidB-like acyl-CoA dehydrogenase